MGESWVSPVSFHQGLNESCSTFGEWNLEANLIEAYEKNPVINYDHFTANRQLTVRKTNICILDNSMGDMHKKTKIEKKIFTA